VVGKRELVVPLPMAEVWAGTQAHVEELTGRAGMQFMRAIMENEVARRVGPSHRPVFGGQEIPLEWPRVRTREGKEVELDSHGQSRQEGKLQRAVRECMVGATGNTIVVTGLLKDLVERRLDAERRYLVVIDGSKALRAGVEGVFGEQAQAQCCRFTSGGM
jgi:hypothetical protein